MTPSTQTLTPVGAAATLRDPATIRSRADYLLQRAERGDSPWFSVDRPALEATADVVADVTRTRYPDLDIPFHSRWRHFETGGVDRRIEWGRDLDTCALADLAVVSVLLDAGAGAHWVYREERTGQTFSRSEGLAVAAWHAFDTGLFSSDATVPHRVDAGGLAALTAAGLAEALQAGPGNPIVGLDGRVAVLNRLGAALADQPETFGPDSRPSGLLAGVLSASRSVVSAPDILSALLSSLSGIWQRHNMIGGEPLGDCWYHPAVPGPGLTRGWMPFHKLSQWLTYSLLEPLQWGGVQLLDIDALTGLPEYRNGGLLMDTGVLKLRDPARAAEEWTAGDELVIEWRALTVALLDRLAPLVRARLGVEPQQMPLACVLEGGTWAAGRELARQRRDGLPPLTITSDGTVF